MFENLILIKKTLLVYMLHFKTKLEYVNVHKKKVIHLNTIFKNSKQCFKFKREF